MTELLLLLAVLALVLVNGFFVTAEFAIVRSRRSRIEQLAGEGNRRAVAALDQLDRIDEFVATCQVGITLASIGIGFLGEPAVADLIEPVIEGPVGHGVALAISVAFAYLVVTLLHVILGEQAPKMLGIARPERLLLAIARPLSFFRRSFHPLIVLTNAPARFLVTRFLRVKVETHEETTPEDLKLLIARSAHGGELDPGEAVMLSGVFHLHEQEARQVMTPIPAVVTVDASETVEAALRRCIDSGHTRLIVTEENNTDRIRGIVHVNSLSRRLLNDGPDASIEPSVRDAMIVPETKPLDDLLADLQRERAALAVVVDEYGRTVGIVSVEDIVEEVVGEISDETDPAVAGVRRLANGDWWVRGHVPITDLADYGLELPEGSDAYNSVGGFVFSEIGRLPKRGDMVRANGYSLRVEAVRENRVDAVRIRDHEPERRGRRKVAAEQEKQADSA